MMFMLLAVVRLRIALVSLTCTAVHSSSFIDGRQIHGSCNFRKFEIHGCLCNYL